jgi:hypothetical protein
MASPLIQASCLSQDGPGIAYYDPAERAREKQASRDADARALASGEKSREQLTRENGLFPPGRVRHDPRSLAF